MSTPRTALVTGANQGLGRALVEGIAARWTPADTVLLTGRDPDRVAAAAQGVGPGGAQVAGLVLDVTDGQAVAAVAAQVAREHGGVDVVVSNACARTTPDQAPADAVDAVLETNNLGTIRMLRSFGPILQPGGRMIVVASSFGTLGHLAPALRPRFDDVRTLDEVEQVLARWRAAVHDGRAEAEGWPTWSNVPSKIGQVAAMRVVAAQRRERDLADGTLVAAVCPGLIDTEASRPWFDDMARAQSPAEAAKAVLELGLGHGPDPVRYGQLVRFGDVLGWRDEVAAEGQAQARVSRSR
jgi:carbonyl reductase 1